MFNHADKVGLAAMGVETNLRPRHKPAIFLVHQCAYQAKTSWYLRMARMLYAVAKAREAYLAEFNQAFSEFSRDNGMEE